MNGPAGLDLIHSFLIVAEELNFRRSAERLHLDQSALSRRIQRLEDALGFRLLERTTREVMLTQAGRSFHADNLHLLTRYDESVQAARRIAQGKTGRLRVAYMAFAATEMMPRTVGRFCAAHPHVEVQLQYTRTQGQKLALANDEIDVGFLIGPFDHSDFLARTLADDALHVVAAPGHPLMALAEVRPADLADQDVILGDMREWGEYRWRLNDMFSAEGVTLRVRLEASNTLALIGLVAGGLGVTICPASLVCFLGPNVARRPLAGTAFCIRTEIVCRRTNRTPQVRAFMEMAAGWREGSPAG